MLKYHSSKSGDDFDSSCLSLSLLLILLLLWNVGVDEMNDTMGQCFLSVRVLCFAYEGERGRE